MMEIESAILVLLAAGSSTRMGGGIKKEYRTLETGTVLSTALKNFLQAANFSSIVIVIPEGQTEEAFNALKAEKSFVFDEKKIVFVTGGKTREDSVLNSLLAIQEKLNPPKKTLVLIHDAARPYPTKKMISDVIEATAIYGAAVPALEPVDTQKIISKSNEIQVHLKRNELAAVQTPQGFLFWELLDCHKRAKEINLSCTDDSEIWDSFPNLTGGKKVHVVKGDTRNKKITFEGDLEKFEKQIKVGFGTDLHRLVEGRKLVIGGIEIPYSKGEEAHSDGDALLHAISDALLGASALGDIGSYFPSEDEKWKDADSKVLLKKIYSDVKNQGWHILNLDCVVELEKPKFLPYRMQVRNSIAQILELDVENVFVKAKTNEGLEAVGLGNAIKTYCVCLLSK